MKQVADGAFQLRGVPPDAFNIFVVRSGERWILVDTGTRHAKRRILKQLPGLGKGGLEAIFITHAHQDHAGAMHAVALATGAPVWGPQGDADALEGKAEEPLPERYRNNFVNRVFAGGWKDRHPVDRRLNEGEAVGEFESVALPGHTPGQLGLWRESDRTLLCADAMRNMNFVTGLPQLGEPPKIFTCDVDEARRTIIKVASMEPRTVAFGHGRPLTRGAARKIGELAASFSV